MDVCTVYVLLDLVPIDIHVQVVSIPIVVQ
jgi:hypothetical protein